MNNDNNTQAKKIVTVDELDTLIADMKATNAAFDAKVSTLTQEIDENIASMNADIVEIDQKIAADQEATLQKVQAIDAKFMKELDVE